FIHYGPESGDHQTTWCAGRAIEFIHDRAGDDAPWLFSVNVFAPHHPFDPPESMLRRYLERLDDLPLPAYQPGELKKKTSHQRRDHAAAYGIQGLYPFDEMTEREHRLVRAAYWAMVDHIDEQTGRVLDALDSSGQRDDTIVIFMSDHGELLGDHGIYLKGPHFYDPSVRVPLIFSLPGRAAAGRRVPALVELVDLAPATARTVVKNHDRFNWLKERISTLRERIGPASARVPRAGSGVPPGSSGAGSR
ncbi:MAG: sulfatase family protein, partial [Opitutaceae bacterium]